MTKQNRYCRVLTIAGSDSGGGAGIQGDLKTFAALGCYGTSVITALTAQNTVEVRSILEVSPEFVGDQFDCVMNDIGTDAIKIGMVHKPEVIRLLAAKLTLFPEIPVVLDPVMVAKSGDHLLAPEAIHALMESLIPHATILTPNLPEAAALLARPLSTPDSVEAGARDLLQLVKNAVLIKGGHSEGPTSDDCLAYRVGNKVKISWIRARRIDTRNTHGTGCCLSSAIAAYLAKGNSLERAVNLAKTYLTLAIENGAKFCLGRGHGPVHHFFEVWKSSPP